MLNKDEYDQEEYNEYYRQETEGIKPEEEEEGFGLISKFLILLILLALSIAGYFGYKAINQSTVDDIDSSLKVSTEPSLPQSIQEKSIEEKPIEEKIETIKKKDNIVKPKKVIKVQKETNETLKKAEPEEKETTVKDRETTTPSEVTKAISAQGKMSPEEIAAVVAAVMKQMNQGNNNVTKSSNSSIVPKEESTLVDELLDSQVDSVSNNLVEELKSVDINADTKIDNNKQKSKQQVDIYNKVNVEETSGSDVLSQLSNQINSVIAEGVKKDKMASYTKSLKSEVTVRTNEMRIIVVQKGDTLGKIAKRAYGDASEYKKIYEANPEVTRADLIYIGQKLRIPN